jgi:hypothetical protein
LKPAPDAWLNRKIIKRGFAGLTAAIALLVGITSLFDFVERKVDSPEPPPPSEIDARVSAVRLTTVREPYGRYLRDTNQSFPGVTRDDRREPGLVFAARVRFKGSQGEKFLLRTTVFNATTQRRVPGYTFEQANFTPSGPSHGREWPFWIPYPPRPGAYFLRATLVDPKKQPVGEQDSKPFRIKRVPLITG